MLAFKKPELRESGAAKPVKDDSGFDKDGVKAVTGADGRAKLKCRQRIARFIFGAT